MASTLDIIIQAQDKASEVFRKVGAESDGLGNKLKALGAVALASGAAFASWKTIDDAIAKTKELGSEVSGLMRITGLSAEAASHLLAAGHDVGVGYDVLNKSLGIFAKNLKGINDAETQEASAAAAAYANSQQHIADVTRQASDSVTRAHREANEAMVALNRTNVSADERATKSRDIMERYNDTLARGTEAVNRASEAHATAAPKVKSFQEALNDLGVKERDVIDESGRLREHGIDLLADGFSKMGPGLDRTADAMALFGKGGKDMLPLLALGAAGLQEAAKQADKLGLTLSGANVNAIKEYSRSQRELNEAVAGVKLQIGLGVMPVLTDLTNIILNITPVVRGFVSDAIDKLSELLPVWEAIKIQAETQIGGVIGIVKNVVDIFEKAADLVSDVAHGDWAGAWADLKDIGEDVAKAFVNNIAMLFGQLPNIMIAAVNEMIKAWNSVQSKFTGKLNLPGLGNVNPLSGQDLSIGQLSPINFELFNLGDALAKIAPLARSAHAAIDTSGLNQSIADIPPVANKATQAHRDLTAAADKTAPALTQAAAAITSVADAAVVAWHQMTDAESQSSAKANAAAVIAGQPYAGKGGGSVAFFSSGYGRSNAGGAVNNPHANDSVAGYYRGWPDGSAGAAAAANGGPLGPYGGYYDNNGVWVPPVGSHAGGLPYVPYDGYPAILHKGEKVLTAAQNADGGGNVVINVNVAGSINGVDDVKRIIRETLSGGGLRGYTFG